MSARERRCEREKRGGEKRRRKGEERRTDGREREEKRREKSGGGAAVCGRQPKVQRDLKKLQTPRQPPREMQGRRGLAAPQGCP